MLDPVLRNQLAERVPRCLESAVSGSTARLRGSLATGNADPYSDIDILWVVPNRAFPLLTDAVGRVLAQIRPVESLRSDPTVRSSGRRLFFARFEDVPLFWRLDLEVVPASGCAAHEDGSDDQDGSHWSRTESALMNAVAAVKAHLRGDDNRAQEVLLPGYARVALAPPGRSLKDQIQGLVEGICRIDPGIDDLSRRVEHLVAEAFEA